MEKQRNMLFFFFCVGDRGRAEDMSLLRGIVEA